MAGLTGLAVGLLGLRWSFGLTRDDVRALFRIASPATSTLFSLPANPGRAQAPADLPTGNGAAAAAPFAWAAGYNGMAMQQGMSPSIIVVQQPYPVAAAPGWPAPASAPAPTVAVAPPAVAAAPATEATVRQAWLRPFPHLETKTTDPEPSTARSHAPYFDRDTNDHSRSIAERFAPSGTGTSPDAPLPRVEPVLPPIVEPAIAPITVAAVPSMAVAPPDASRPVKIVRGGFYDRLLAGRGPATTDAPPRKSTARTAEDVPLSLLQETTPLDRSAPPLGEDLRSQQLVDTLGDFGVKGEITAIRPGPVVTLYEFEPARGTKSCRIIGLADESPAP